MQDERLADFTDRVLAGKADQSETDADEELLALEETILRVQKAFPPVHLSQAAVKQMQARFKSRLKKQEKASEPFWKKWLASYSNASLSMTFAAAALMLLLAVLVFPSTPTGNSLPGTAMRPSSGVLVFIVLLFLFAAVFWINRKK